MIDIIVVVIAVVYQMAVTLLCYVLFGLKFVWKVFIQIASFISNRRQATVGKKNVSLSLNSSEAIHEKVPVESHGLFQTITSLTCKQTQVVPIVDVGTLTLHRLVSTALVERVLTITNLRLVREFGTSKLQLPNLSINTSTSEKEIFDISIRDTENFLNEKWNQQFDQPKQQDQQLQKVQPIVQSIVPEVKIADSLPEQLPVIAPSNSPKSLKTVPDKGPKNIDTKTKIYGKFIGSGRGRKPGKDFEQFFVHIYDDAMDGSENKVWGATLQDALEVAKVSIGDRICITSFGFVPVILPGGKKSQKQMFEINHVR